MPVITPAYPSMCATHNISNFTKRIICREMERAFEIVEKIFSKQLRWKDLFSRHSFFTDGYKYYLGVIAASRSREAQLTWSGLVESKVRLLVSLLEHVESIELAHPFVKGFDRVHRCRTEEEVERILQGDLRFHAKRVQTESTDLVHGHQPDRDPNGNTPAPPQNGGAPDSNGDDAGNGFRYTIYTTTFYIGIEIAQGQPRASVVDRICSRVLDGTKQLDLSYSTNEFKELCTGWQQFNPDQNSVTVSWTRK